ncbi:MAG: MFS transporter [Woeseia sp.]|nr:MFS transporter [Woeseia sp.]|tara:strand:+ start:696 stop:1913 length:1218 start_codon:yes stop_codon:yes gene_type:complete
MQIRNLFILITCQLISSTGQLVMVMLGGIIGSEMSPNKAFATLPYSVMIISLALTTVPAAIIMSKIGRRAGFTISSIVAAVGLMIAIAALKESNFLLFNFALAMFGINMAFTQQYRYAAAESVESKHVPRAISLVLIGPIGAAFLGKEIVTFGHYLIPQIQYGGIMMILSIMFVIQALFFLNLRSTEFHADPHESSTKRSIGEIVLQPIFISAVLGAMAGAGIMTLLMTATPISMHINNSYTLEQTAYVIQIHVLGMYVPSLLTGFLIEKYGVIRIMLAGVIAFFSTSIIGYQGHSFMHYWWALFLLGIGWNFLFVGGTTMLTYTYSSSEKFKAQAVNEFLVFGTSAIASLLAGSVMYLFGWIQLMLIPIPMLIIVCVSLLSIRKNSIFKNNQNKQKGKEVAQLQ